MNESDRRKTIWRIVIFSVLVNAAAWIASLLGGSPSSPELGFILWGMAPLLVSIVMRVATRDWADLGIKPAFKKNAVWYVVSVVVIPILMLLTLWTGVLTSIASVSEFSLGKFFQSFLTALPIFFVFAIFEEVGWRGYLSPKLDSLGVNRFVASAIVGFVWATWHMPYISELSWAYISDDLTTFIPRFYLVCFALSILFGEIRSVTGTYWTAILLHGVSNSFGHPLAAEYVTYAAGREFLASIGNGLILIVLAGLAGSVINRWRVKNRAADTHS